MKSIYAILAVFLLCTNAWALDVPLSNEADEARAHLLFSELRCMVCQGQSLEGSNAKIAIQMRKLIREKITEGESNEAILTFFAERYGDEILTNPPMKEETIALWYAPAGFLIIGLLSFALFMRKKA